MEKLYLSMVCTTLAQFIKTEFRGFAIYDDFAPLIFINQNDATRATLFTLVHEFCHILLSSSGISGLSTRNKTESFCNKAASEYLVPRKEFVTLWNQDSTVFFDEKIAHLADYFRVSRWVVLIKARELGFTNQMKLEEHQEVLLKERPAQKHTKGSRGPSYNTMQSYHFSDRLVNAAVIAAYSGSITFKDAMGLTKLGPKGIQAKAEELRL